MKPIKTLLLLAGLLWLAAGAFGAQVDDKTAAAAVTGWLRFDHNPLGASLGQTVKNVETFKDGHGAPLYHVVNLEPSGYVIVPAEDQVDPIIAFVENGRFDPSPQNPLGALISRDVPAHVARARARAHGGNPTLLATRNKTWQTLLQNAAGGPQPKGLGDGGISDMRVAPFIQTLWDQGNVPTTVTNLISVNNQIVINTHFVNSALGDIATASVVCPTNQGNVLISPGNPAIHSFSGGGSVTVDVNNGPDSTVTNLISVTETIHIVFHNSLGQTITDQYLTGTVVLTNIVSGGTPGNTVTTTVGATVGFIMVVSDMKACYNYFTPPTEPGNTNNYVCGCVATAMAQLMYYFQCPSTGVGTPCFTITVNGNSMGRNLHGGDGKGGPYDWTDMPLAPAYFPLTPIQAQAIGNLTFDAGVAVHMQYAASGSGAYMTDAKTALVNTFKYSNAIENPITNLDTGCFECNLYNMMNPNLDAGLPVLLGITGDPGNHCIVVDGYGYSFGTLYHHLNMGWSGDYNAWYALPVIDMLNDDGTYTYFWEVTDCLYNVYTNGSGEIISGRVVDASGAPVNGASITATRIGGGTYTAVTGPNGIYSLVGVPSASTYTITVTDTGLFPGQQQLQHDHVL